MGKKAILQLCHKQEPLTGDDIQMIRDYFSMTLSEFGTQFGYSHVAVLKWEKKGKGFAKIEPVLDACIRLFAFRRLNPSGTKLYQLYKEIDIAALAKYKRH